jgi:hypothetical protein
MVKKLEENLEKVEENRKKLQTVMSEIDRYNYLPDNEKNYKRNLDTRDNLAISLNYLQNQILIEQNSEIIKYFKELNK